MSKLRLFIHKWWPIFALFAMPLQTLLILAIAFLFLYNRSAKNQWEAHLHELSELGEVLDPLLLAPPPVENPEENFAEAPIVKAVRLLQRDFHLNSEEIRIRNIFNVSKILNSKFSENTPPEYIVHPNFSDYYPHEDTEPLLAQIRAHESEFAEEFDALREAALRKFSNEHLNYGTAKIHENRDPLGLLSLVKSLALCTQVHIEDNISEKALINTHAQIRIVSHIGNEPSLLSLLTCSFGYDDTIRCIQAGLLKRIWTDAQCLILANSLSKNRFSEQAILSFRLEQAQVHQLLKEYQEGSGNYSNHFHELPTILEKAGGTKDLYLPHLLFEGWFYENTLMTSRIYQKHVFALGQGATESGIFPLRRKIESEKSSLFSNWFLRIRYGLTISHLNRLLTACNRAERTDSYMKQARIGLAIERYRIKHGNLPKSLSEIHDFIEGKIPQDPHAGNDFIYRNNGDGTYLLYGLGYNGTDDGGLTRKSHKRKERTSWKSV